MPSFIKVFVPVRAKACKDADFTFDISIQTFDAGLTNNPNERGYFRTRKKVLPLFPLFTVLHVSQPVRRRTKEPCVDVTVRKTMVDLKEGKKRLSHSDFRISLFGLRFLLPN